MCTKPGETIYVQASYIVAEQTTRDREFGPLEKIRDNHPKYVISATPLLTMRDEQGITHLSLRKFLKEGFIKLTGTISRRWAVRHSQNTSPRRRA